MQTELFALVPGGGMGILLVWMGLMVFSKYGLLNQLLVHRKFGKEGWRMMMGKKNSSDT